MLSNRSCGIISFNDNKCNIRSDSIWYNVSLWSPKSKYYLVKNVDNKGKNIECVRDTETDGDLLCITDTRDIKTDYELYTEPTILAYSTVTSLIIAGIAGLTYILKRK